MKKPKKLTKKQYETKLKALEKKPKRNPLADSANRRKAGVIKSKKDKDRFKNYPIDSTEDDSWFQADYTWSSDDGWIPIQDGNDILKDLIKDKK